MLSKNHLTTFLCRAENAWSPRRLFSVGLQRGCPYQSSNKIVFFYVIVKI